MKIYTVGIALFYGEPYELVKIAFRTKQKAESYVDKYTRRVMRICPKRANILQTEITEIWLVS